MKGSSLLLTQVLDAHKHIVSINDGSKFSTQGTVKVYSILKHCFPFDKNMRKLYYRLSIIFLTLSIVYGCAGFLHYPPVQKKLFSREIPKNQVDAIKNTILSNGYKRITRDNYPYEGAIVTQYAKEISTTQINSRVLIMLNFKETTVESDFYRNMGIRITNLDRNDIPEINDEVDRMEQILYNKLLEVAGSDNVVRGKR